uniref:Putative secreted protein n=1 Tax=Anopheles darlingi TaxID=43151 RepID=A0A2M4DGE0_ANODA
MGLYYWVDFVFIAAQLTNAFYCGFVPQCWRAHCLGMRLHVRAKGYELDKPFAALRTRVWPFAGVRHHVMFQCFRFRKRLATVWAFERFDAPVHYAHVSC